MGLVLFFASTEVNAGNRPDGHDDRCLLVRFLYFICIAWGTYCFVSEQVYQTGSN